MNRTNLSRALILAAFAGAGLGGIALSQSRAPAVEAPRRIDSKAVEKAAERAQSVFAAPESAEAIAVAQTSAAAAAQCQAPISAIGQGKLQSGARWSSKLNWENEVKATYGANWNDWADAIDQNTSCAHDGRPPHLREWLCIATASACYDDGSGSTSTGSSSSTGSSTSGGSPACYPAISVEGDDAKTQMPAEARAVSAWQEAAGNNHGPGYQAWGKAQGQDITCRHNGLGPLQRRWRCIATAQPCQ